jgi:predicted Rossmann fold nucleotide-binding protein DprA/Smf involved in DNA uptake
MTTPSPEVVRTKVELRTIYEENMVDIVELMAQGLDGDSYNECVSRGWAVLAILIGGLTISRAVASIKTADQIAITNAAIYAAGKTRKARGHSR